MALRERLKGTTVRSKMLPSTLSMNLFPNSEDLSGVRAQADKPHNLSASVGTLPGIKILHSIASVNPTSGGPIEGIKQLSKPLREMGCRVEVVSGDAPGDPWVNEFPLPIHPLGPRTLPLKYNLTPRLPGWIREHASDYDLIVINGVWQFSSFGTWLGLRHTLTPYFVFPHGMLDPWFKHQYPLKHLKKWFYWPWAEYQVLRGAAAVVFTCDKERILARESFWLYNVRERVVNYGTADPNIPPNAKARFQERYPEVIGRKVLLFLGRIHIKKGCDILLDAFAQTTERNKETILVMAGPDSSEWGQKLRERARDLRIDERVCWTGPLFGDLKWGAFASADAFILPSHQENFGISVAESLACGVPVLVSRAVNIHEEIESDGAGFADEDTIAGTARLIRRWLETDPDEWVARKASARRCFLARFEIHSTARSFLQIFAETRASGV